jgi:hypothetical protein
MPDVLDDTDILDHSSPSSAGNALHTGPHRWPTVRREYARFLALFQHLCTPAPELQLHQQGHGTSGASPFETPLDLLARHHPSLHLWLMSCIG